MPYTMMTVETKQNCQRITEEAAVNFVWESEAELVSSFGLSIYIDVILCMLIELYDYNLHFCLLGVEGLPSDLPLKFSIKTKTKPNVKTSNPEPSM